MAKANFILTLFGEMSRKNIGQKKGGKGKGGEKKLKKIYHWKKEIEREAEALEKEVSGRKDLDHITVSEDMEEALFQKNTRLWIWKTGKSCIS